MTRDFLKNLAAEDGATIPEGLIGAIMQQHGKDVESHKQQLAALTAERDGLQASLASANDQIKAFTALDVEAIKKSAEEWEAKYNSDVEKLNAELSAMRYSHAVDSAISDLKFTSAAAKKAFVADLTAKGLAVEDGKLKGLQEYLKEYRENDPDAFAADNPKPAFSGKTGGKGGAPETDAVKLARQLGKAKADSAKVAEGIAHYIG